MKLFAGKITWDWKHSLILVGTTLAGATVGYLDQQSPGAIFDAFTSWAKAMPIVRGIGIADISALLLLAKQSFITPPAPPPALPAQKEESK